MKYQYCLNLSFATNYMHFDKPQCPFPHSIGSFIYYNSEIRCDDYVETLLGGEDWR